MSKNVSDSVSTLIGGCLWTGKASRYSTKYPGQPGLIIYLSGVNKSSTGRPG